ncbi:hypothetical protein Q8F55_008570 [Vanrija albida]|uniref:Zn(2)-C6 fungal-type domain-containing protein n=1 Tax=Vanrija albida TaxID=181172 RepID=A0ABR3PS80_9TREE
MLKRASLSVSPTAPLLAMPDTSPPRKRKRHTRKTSGCRECRRQHIRCAEGATLPSGRRAACRRCWQTDQPCFYPANGRVRKGELKDETWERAEDVETWVPEGERSSPEAAFEFTPMLAAGRLPARPRGSVESLDVPLVPLPLIPVDGDPGSGSSYLSESSGLSSDATLLSLSTGDTTLPLPLATVPESPLSNALTLHGLSPWSVSASNMLCLLGGEDDDAADENKDSKDTTVRVIDAVADANQDMAAWLPKDVWSTLLSPAPSKSLSLFSLASLSTSPVDRTVVSYFELQGHNDIVAVASSRQNWIFTQLFPRLFAILFAPEDRSAPPITGVIRDWLQGCLLHLAYVHRGNVEKDPPRSWYWRSEAAKCRQAASYALLRAKVTSTNGEWKTEEYLMGFFVRCMADMLDSGQLQVDRTTAFELPDDTGSPMYPSLRDLITVYSTLQYACTAFDTRAGFTSAPPFQLRDNGPQWVEKFFGCSRTMIRLLGRASGMVAQRTALLHTGSDGTAPGLLLRAEAEKLVGELGDSWDWDESTLDVGRSDRVQRGSEVMRYALRTMLLCEVLNVDLADRRIVSGCSKAIEIVADCEPSNMPGFQWALTVRERLASLMALTLAISFGPNYRGTKEILALCWEVLDTQGAYENGIAPWREAMNALGRNLWI